MCVGNLAKTIKHVSDEMIEWKTEGTQIYHQLAADMQNEWKACEPLRKSSQQKIVSNRNYKTWGETRLLNDFDFLFF